MSKRNYALIIGGMKCGSTSLFAYLSSHPQVCPCGIKEPNFFLAETFYKGEAWYEKQWIDWDESKHKIALEASVCYTKTLSQLDQISARIAEFPGNFKLIFIARDPIARIESHYTHGYADKWPVAERPLSDYVDPYLVEVSRYARQLDAYAKRFGIDNLHIVNFEYFQKSPSSTLAETIKYMGISSGHTLQGLNVRHNESQGKIRLNRIGALATHRFVGAMLPKWLKRTARPLGGRFVKKNFRLKSEQRRNVAEQLREELLQLRDRYNVDISNWPCYAEFPDIFSHQGDTVIK